MDRPDPLQRDAPTHHLYDGDGRELRYAELLDRTLHADVVLFGEIHGHPLVHRLERDLARDLAGAWKDRLVLGAEMLEADNQLIVDEYLAGLIEHRHLVNEAKVWENYETDYRPLVDLARERGIRFIATNAPRRYANLVAREGLAALERLSGEALRSLAPLPIEVDLSAPGYQQALEIGRAHGADGDARNFVAAQAVKDATMAYFIVKNRCRGGLFIHFNGDYHSKDRGGIAWYLRRAEPGIAVLTLSSVAGDRPGFDPAWKGRADIVLLVPPVPEGNGA